MRARASFTCGVLMRLRMLRCLVPDKSLGSTSANELPWHGDACRAVFVGKSGLRALQFGNCKRRNAG
ncbi:MAG: hypothetical protein NVS9B14_03690 [Candidatus Acidiferrum sp.]